MKEFLIFIYGLVAGFILCIGLVGSSGCSLDRDLVVKSVDQEYILLNGGYKYISYQEGVSVNDTFRIVKVNK